jgi:predicted GNAT superfamily acetyltransferase
VLHAVETIDTREDGEWIVCARTQTDAQSRRVLVAVPPRFTEMQAHAPEPAMAWRLAARDVFSAYFARGYRAVDFFLNRRTGGGQYLLAASEGS